MSDIEHSLLYCGVGFLPNYISIGNLVSLYFYSSSSVSRPGFELFYTCNSTIPPTQPPTPTPVQCGGQLNGPSGTVTSPGWPSNYPNSTECTWNISCNPQEAVNIIFPSPINIEEANATHW